MFSGKMTLWRPFLKSRFWKQTTIVVTYLLQLLLKWYVGCSWNNYVLSRCYWTVANIFYPLISPNDHSGTFCFYWGPFIFHRIIAMFKKKKWFDNKEENIKVTLNITYILYMSGRLLLRNFRCTIVVVSKQFLIDQKFSTGHDVIIADLK